MESTRKMIKQLIKSIFFLLIITTTTVWLGHHLCQYIENNKYELSNSLDNEKTEKQTEIEIDTEFTNELVFYIAENNNYPETKKECTSYLFKSNEIFIKKILHPPKVV